MRRKYNKESKKLYSCHNGYCYVFSRAVFHEAILENAACPAFCFRLSVLQGYAVYYRCKFEKEIKMR